jgi:hypothetical protein
MELKRQVVTVYAVITGVGISRFLAIRASSCSPSRGEFLDAAIK